jgi:hypothetical protein
MKPIELIDAWIFTRFDSLVGGLPIYRIFFAAALLLFHLPLNSPAAGMPASFFRPPPSIAMFFHGFPPTWVFVFADYLLILGALCLLFGYRTRLVGRLWAALDIAVNSFTFSLGRIEHTILIPATVLCLSWSAWGERYSADAHIRLPLPRSRWPTWPVTLLMFTLGLCMLSAALPKIRTGWLGFSDECCRGQIIGNYIWQERPSAAALLILSIHSHLFWKLLDWGTITLEISFIFAMFSLLAMRLTASVACLFHAGIFYSMKIFFYSNLTTYAVLIDYRAALRWRWFRRMLQHFDRLARRIHPVLLALVLAPLYGLYLAGGGSPRWHDDSAFPTILIALLLGVGTLAAYFLRGLRGFRLAMLGKGRSRPEK